MLVLASQSPRRRQLLEQLGVVFEVRAQDIDESLRPGEPAAAYVQRLAQEKAAAGLAAAAGHTILAADTSVVVDGQVLGKPADRDDSLAMLKLLSGRRHQVLSAICLQDHQRSESRLSSSEVEFRCLSESEMLQYWLTGEPLGKAGGYAIQGFAAAFVRSLQGSYSGVMGLPLFETAELLDSFAIPHWQELSTG